MNELKTRLDNTAIVNDMPRESVRELLELLEKVPIEIISSAKSGLNITCVLDAFDNEFLLGEILYSGAEILFNSDYDFIKTTDSEPERSLAITCTNIVLMGKDDILKARVQKLLERERATLALSKKRQISAG